MLDGEPGPRDDARRESDAGANQPDTREGPALGSRTEGSGSSDATRWGGTAHDSAEVDADAPVTARSWNEVRRGGVEPDQGEAPDAATGPSATADRADLEPAAATLRPRVMRADQAPTAGGSRPRLTPATVLAIALLLVSSAASLVFVLGRGGVALPSVPPTIPIALATDPVASTSPAPTDPGSSPGPSPAVATGSPVPPSPSPVPPSPTPVPPSASPPQRLGEDHPDLAYEGSWERASSPDYAGGAVAWTTEAGASVFLVFNGRTITWFGPVGPTRGSAAVYLDGAEVTTVSQYAASFTARRVLYSHTFSAQGSHTIRIVATGTAGHPMVAIDEFVVGY